MLQLVLPDGRRVPLVGEVTIGRASGNTVSLHDRTVSRRHLRIDARGRRVTAEDCGSTFGTRIDGRPLEGPADLQDGTRLMLGAVELHVESPRRPEQAGHTVVVRAGESLEMPAGADGPRLRSGYALKRLEAAEGDRRWVLKSLRSGRFVRLGDGEAELVQLLDGRPAPELVAAAAERLGADGAVRLARLLAELADRGLLAGVDGPGEEPAAKPGALRRLVGPRELEWHGAGDAIDRVYRSVGRFLVGEVAVTALACLAAAGIGVFAYLVAGRYGTPFVVARKVGVGALVFLLG